MVGLEVPLITPLAQKARWTLEVGMGKLAAFSAFPRLVCAHFFVLIERIKV